MIDAVFTKHIIVTVNAPDVVSDSPGAELFHSFNVMFAEAPNISEVF